MSDNLEDELREVGWTLLERGVLSLWIRNDRDYGPDPLELISEWIQSESSSWNASDSRGKRYTVNESPSGDERWFLKQYHHGGLLAGDEDVYYSSPARFQAELLASTRAYEHELNVPAPKGVFYQEHDEGYEGFYFSKFLNARTFTRTLRERGKSILPQKAGQKLALLHDLEIDHGDYHVGNLKVDDSEEVVITDFDPVEFGEIRGYKREQRIQRFMRSLNKNGFNRGDVRAFRRGYRQYAGEESSGRTRWFLGAINFAKNTLSDSIYFLQERSIEASNLEKVLIRAPNWLGDAVMSLPFIESLAAHEAEPTVDVVARESVVPVYQNHGSVRKVLKLPSEKTFVLPDVREERYSLLIVIPKSIRTGLQSFLSDIPRRVGFSDRGRSLFFTDRIELGDLDRKEHHARLYFRLLKDTLEPPSELMIRNLQAPSDSSIDLKRGSSNEYITFHPGSAYGPAKRWPADQFRAFLNKILDETTLDLVAMGVENELDLAEEIIDPLASDRIINLVGETTLPEAMTVLDNSRGTVANDSGLMHLSAALGTPTLGLFGSSDPSLTHPIGETTGVLYEGVECSPCFERTCPRDDELYKCLTNIDPDEVFGHFEELIDV